MAEIKATGAWLKQIHQIARSAVPDPAVQIGFTGEPAFVADISGSMEWDMMSSGFVTLLVIAFIFLFKIGDTMATTLSTSFFLDIGFTRTEIGIVAKTTALVASVAGGIIGGVWLVKIGIGRGLWIFGALQMVSTLGFAWLAQLGPGSPVLAVLYDFTVSTSHAIASALSA